MVHMQLCLMYNRYMKIQEGLIYRIANVTNGKSYIGKTVQTVERRWTQHKAAALKGVDTALYSAIRKYGESSFVVSVLAETLEPFLNTLEPFFICLFSTHVSSGGYNMTPGADGLGAGLKNPNFGKKHSDATKMKMSLSRGHSAESVRKRISDSLRGGKHTAESKRKMSEAAKGRKVSLETRMKLSASLRGRTRSEETKRKMSLARKGIPLSPEHRLKIGETSKGRLVSEETRQKHRLRMTGVNNPMFGKPPSEVHRRRLIEAWVMRRERASECLCAA